MLPPFRMGAGGRVGSGMQGMSWIGLDDLLGILLRAIVDDRLSGGLNATAPNPVSQLEFARTLAKVLHRPAIMPLPAAAVAPPSDGWPIRCCSRASRRSRRPSNARGSVSRRRPWKAASRCCSRVGSRSLP